MLKTYYAVARTHQRNAEVLDLFARASRTPKNSPEGTILLRLMLTLGFGCASGTDRTQTKEVNDNMGSGITIRAVAAVLLVTLAMTVSTVHAIPWSDCHGIDPFEEEAELVADYTDADYSAPYFHNWDKDDILDDSLPYADI